jgi:CDGSH iron-sulfur domain-containing protein 3
MTEPVIYACNPISVKVEAGKTYSWCTCGLSEKTPFCDSSHKRIEGLPFKSIKVQFETEQEVLFCQCKRTKTPPFCDGTHHSVSENTENGS